MRYLIAYNDTNISEKALDVAIERALKFGGNITVVHSIRGGGDTTHSEYEHARSLLDRASQKLTQNNIEHHCKLLSHMMSPGEDIVQHSNEQYYDEIIIGIQNKSKVGKFVFGSNAQYVILMSSQPVLCIK